MRAAYLRSEETLRRLPHLRAQAAEAAIEIPTRYEGATGPNWGAIGLLVAGHAAMFAVLLMTGVVPTPKIPKPPIVVELIPLPEAPPPPPAPAETPVPDVVVPVAPVAPPPIVQVAVPTPPPIQTVAVAPPPAAPAASASEAKAAATPALPSVSLAGLPGNPPLKYPLEARRKHQEGVVRLCLVVDPTGRVANISVARSSGSDSLDDAALKVTRKWMFQPVIDAGRPVSATGCLNQTFLLAR